MIKIAVVFFIIMLIFNNISPNILIKIILLVCISHLAKLIFVYKTWKKKKTDVSGLDGPQFYIKINTILCGKNWHKKNLWPKLFVPTIRIWLCIIIILYNILYYNSYYMKIAMII